MDFPKAVAQYMAGFELDAVVESLSAQLTEDERLWLLDGDVAFWQGLTALYSGHYSKRPYSFGAIPRLNFPGAQYVDGPRGVNICQATAFPVSMARGATWDPELEEKIANAIGLEARAMGANLVGSVCVNLPRHPRWGRVQETYGEDPILLGEFGAAHVRGLQKNVMACVKHYALNSMEIARFRVNVVVADDALHEVYLPHFHRCLEENAASFMTSYNAINGEWGGEHVKLISEVLLDQWKFKGFTISDWVFGLRDGLKSINAGLTLEAPFQNCRHRTVRDGLASGAITWSDIVALNKQLLRGLVRSYASREKQQPPQTVVLSPEHRKLARDAAQRAIVLLKNEAVNGAPTLPLSPSIASCAVVGRLADSIGTGDSASSMVDCPKVVSLFQGIKDALPQAQVLLSASDATDAAIAHASCAEVAVVVVGYNDEDEGEFLMPSRADDPEAFAAFPPYDNSPYAQKIQARTNQQGNGGPKENQPKAPTQFADLSSRPKPGDRKSVRLRPEDVNLIQAVSKANPRTIVTIVTAGAVIIEEWRDLVETILISWYNGCEAGNALADVLLGKGNPSGRLPWSMPRDEAHLPSFDPYARQIVYDKWIGQRRLDHLGVTAAYPLGYGISYTKFRLRDASILNVQRAPDTKDRLILCIQITNEGDRDGRCVVQSYANPQGLGKTDNFPSQVLVGFSSVHVKAQETRRVEVHISLRPVMRWIGGHFVPSSNSIIFATGQYCGDPESLPVKYQILRAKV